MPAVAKAEAQPGTPWLFETGTCALVGRGCLQRQKKGGGDIVSNVWLTTLIDTAALAAHLDDPRFAIVDCRFALSDKARGAREYAAAHIPGAVFADLAHDLSAPPTGRNGRHPLPDAATVSSTLGRLGIGDGIQVIAYDQDSGMFASRLWWMLRWMGHDAAAVLDGGFAKWRAEGRATSSGIERRSAREFHGAPRQDMTVDAGRVGELLGRAQWRLLDARAPERYRGEVEPIDTLAGHIPGAINHPYASNLAGDNTFIPPEELRAKLTRSLAGVPAEQTVCYCGSGVTACHNVLALEHAGLHGAKLYPGSWSEWSSDPSRPVEKS
jgi:thiosulfate/3-mercaptopyruvate sulfurtransferase